MWIEDMTREMSLTLLQNAGFGRLACAKGMQPYITPFSFTYDDDYLYSFGTVGKKIEWMRANPLVCIEVENLASREEWQTVIVYGRYQELPQTTEFSGLRGHAHDLLAVNPNWWLPGYAQTIHHATNRPLEPIYFRISIEEITGHMTVPAKGTLISPTHA